MSYIANIRMILQKKKKMIKSFELRSILCYLLHHQIRSIHVEQVNVFVHPDLGQTKRIYAMSISIIRKPENHEEKDINQKSYRNRLPLMTHS